MITVLELDEIDMKYNCFNSDTEENTLITEDIAFTILHAHLGGGFEAIEKVSAAIENQTKTDQPLHAGKYVITLTA